jgi:hypothetical protein
MFMPAYLLFKLLLVTQTPYIHLSLYMCPQLLQAAFNFLFKDYGFNLVGQRLEDFLVYMKNMRALRTFQFFHCIKKY